MSIKYICRHCNASIGEIQHSAVSETSLGFHWLTPSERREMIAYDGDGNTTVKVICDYCKEALDHNPELVLSPSPLQ